MIPPSPCHAVPFLGGSDDNITIFNVGHMMIIRVTCQLSADKSKTRELLIPVTSMLLVLSKARDTGKPHRFFSEHNAFVGA